MVYLLNGTAVLKSQACFSPQVGVGGATWCNMHAVQDWRVDERVLLCEAESKGDSRAASSA